MKINVQHLQEEESPSIPIENIEDDIFEREMIVQGQRKPGVPVTTNVHNTQKIGITDHFFFFCFS